MVKRSCCERESSSKSLETRSSIIHCFSLESRIDVHRLEWRVTSISIVSRSSRGLVHTSSISLVSFLTRLEKWYLNSRQQQARNAHSNIDSTRL